MLWCCESRPAFSDPPCLGGKSLEVGTISQAVPRHCPAWCLLGLQCMGSFLGCLCPVPAWNLCPSWAAQLARTALENTFISMVTAEVCVRAHYTSLKHVHSPLLCPAEVGAESFSTQSVCQAGALHLLRFTKGVLNRHLLTVSFCEAWSSTYVF